MARLTNVDTQIVSLVKRGAVRDPDNPTEPQRYLLWKAEDHDAQSGANPLEKEDQMDTIDDVRAALAKAEQERDAEIQKGQELAAKVEELEKAQPTPGQVHTDTPDNEDDLTKADLPEPVKAALKKAEDDRTEALKKAEEAEKIAKAERDLRIEREYIAKAENEFAYVGGSPTEFGKLLKSASENLSKDDFEQLEKILKGADAGLAKSELFTEIGRSGEATREARDQVQKQEDRAAELRKENSELSKSDALARAIVESRR